MTNMKKLMLTSALALCAPAAFAAPAAGKVSCTPEQTGVGGMVNTTVCEVKGASLDEAYRALYHTKNKHIKSYLHDLKLPAKLPAKSTKLLVPSGGTRDCGSKTKVDGKWVDDVADPKMELNITRRPDQVRILAQEVDNCVEVENFVITFKRVGKNVKMVYEWHHA
ncbi:hypothetical protein HMPREF9123_0579 [Neisseria bacilliformis ATCC BAA-1200]|uniref:Secreted protein n=2 Tax=Neisseria TaxID=482 RepID=F2B9Y0_9NEIS|nr:hypothetical protein HMPREF9123_0579 [Neisseria bacilliformis ATCC BAA-1200]